MSHVPARSYGNFTGLPGRSLSASTWSSSSFFSSNSLAAIRSASTCRLTRTLLFFRAEKFKRILHGHPSLIKLQNNRLRAALRPMLC